MMQHGNVAPTSPTCCLNCEKLSTHQEKKAFSHHVVHVVGRTTEEAVKKNTLQYNIICIFIQSSMIKSLSVE